MNNKNSLLHSIVSKSREIIPGNILLAPMAGFTDQAFRHLCTENGADMCFTEMVSSEALVRKSFKTLDLLKRAENENIYAVQLFSSSPETAAESLKIIASFRPALIDLNCGCPVPKILKSGAGCALMRNPEKIGAIVKALKEASDIPVSVKLRAGWDSNEITFIHAAVQAAEAGASIITLHPRTRVQGYSGKADWSRIKMLKKEIDLPVIGSGDLFTPRDCLEMLETTGCDGIMVARGAAGNPDIFHKIKMLAQNFPVQESGHRGRIENAIRHVSLSEKYNSGKTAVNEIKKHLCSYIKEIPGAALYRGRLMQCTAIEEYKEVLEELQRAV